MTEPTVSILRPSEQAMSISAALRQAAIDMPPMLDGFTVSASMSGDGLVLVARVQVKNAHGFAVWTQDYDGKGRRITVGGGIRF